MAEAPSLILYHNLSQQSATKHAKRPHDADEHSGQGRGGVHVVVVLNMRKYTSSISEILNQGNNKAKKKTAQEDGETFNGWCSLNYALMLHRTLPPEAVGRPRVRLVGVKRSLTAHYQWKLPSSRSTAMVSGSNI